MYTVYCHTNVSNGKKYFGITSQEPKSRWGTNGRNYQDKCPRFWNAIQKYGWDSFEHEIIAIGLTKEEACTLEINLISQYRTQEKAHGYNILEGGDAPLITDDVKKKISKAMEGNKNALGHSCTDEKKRKISKAQKGRKLSEEHRKKLSATKKGKSHKPLSDETRKKLSDAHKKKPVFCIELNKTFCSIQNCAKELQLSASAICACCKSRHKSVHGYHFQYAAAA